MEWLPVLIVAVVAIAIIQCIAYYKINRAFNLFNRVMAQLFVMVEDLEGTTEQLKNLVHTILETVTTSNDSGKEQENCIKQSPEYEDQHKSWDEAAKKLARSGEGCSPELCKYLIDTAEVVAHQQISEHADTFDKNPVGFVQSLYALLIMQRVSEARAALIQLWRAAQNR